MRTELSSNAQAILLLTAPLIAGRGRSSTAPLTPSEYRRLARRLRELQREPADLLDLGAGSLLKECGSHPDAARLELLLGRGFLLSQAVERREHREALMNGRLALMCPYDPAARFNVGHAMQRNKLIYALADAALVVNSDYGKGGTWAGATEQLERLKLVSVYVRADGDMGKGLAELQRLGAKPWPNPKTPQELEEILDSPSTAACSAPEQWAKLPGVHEKSGPLEGDRSVEAVTTATTHEPRVAPQLFARGRSVCQGRGAARSTGWTANRCQRR